MSRQPLGVPAEVTELTSNQARGDAPPVLFSDNPRLCGGCGHDLANGADHRLCVDRQLDRLARAKGWNRRDRARH